MNDNQSTFPVDEKIQILLLSKWLDREPQICWTTYLQTRMIGSDTPAQMAISHLLRNQIIQ